MSVDTSRAVGVARDDARAAASQRAVAGASSCKPHVGPALRAPPRTRCSAGGDVLRARRRLLSCAFDPADCLAQRRACQDARPVATARADARAALPDARPALRRRRTIGQPRATFGQDGAARAQRQCASRAAAPPFRGAKPRNGIPPGGASHHERTHRLSRPQDAASRRPGRAATTPSSAPRCRSSASSSPKPATCAGTSASSTSPPATATRRSPRRAAAASVTSTDYVSALLDRGAERARAERLDVTFQVADAEALPFDDASFDAVLSTFGVMFAPDHATAAAEMARVCRPGGRIGLANWTPESLIGQMFKVLGKHLPPPAGVQPPSLWGDRRRTCETLFGERAVRRSTRRRASSTSATARRRTSSTSFRTWYGPVHKAFARAAGRQGRGARARPHRAAERLEPSPARSRWSCRASTSRSSSPAAELERHGRRPATARPALRLGPGGSALRAAVAGAARRRRTTRCCAGAALAPGERVLDVACGTGLVALAAARAVGASRARGRRRPVRPHGRRGAPARPSARPRERELRAHGRRAPGASRRQLRRRAVRARPHVRARSRHARARDAPRAAARRPRGGRRLGRTRTLRLVARCSRSSTPRSRATSARCSSGSGRRGALAQLCADAGFDDIDAASHRRDARPTPMPTKPATPRSSAARSRSRGRASTRRSASAFAGATSRRSSRGADGRGYRMPGEFVVAVASTAPSGRA